MIVDVNVGELVTPDGLSLVTCHCTLRYKQKTEIKYMLFTGLGWSVLGKTNLYSAFSMWIYSNALYNTLWGTLPDCFMAQFTIFLK